MIFSVNHHSFRKQQANEIRCPCNQLGTIFDFIKENPNKRYNILNLKEQDYNKAIEQINYVREVASDYTVECEDIHSLLLLLEGNINAYLRYPITDWEMFTDLAKNGSSDILIDGPLCFQMDKIKRIKEDYPVKIRVSPVLSPNSSVGGRTPQSFFIRPEDLHLYENAVDIIDFLVRDQDKEDALFDIYKRGTFNYSLSDLLMEKFDPDINNILLDGSNFAQYRLTCAQRCKIPGRICRYCENAIKVMNNAIKVAEVEKKEKEEGEN